MKNITYFSTFILLLVQCAVPVCSARSGRRASPLALGDDPSLCVLNGSLAAGPADPSLRILSRVPHDEKIGGLTLRITTLKAGPFISSYNLLPCMVDVLNTAFDAIWNVVDQHTHIYNNEFTCSENGLTLRVLSNKPPLQSMEYSDLVYLARLLLNFQQVYRLPGITFDYLEDGKKTGTGEINWNHAASSIQGLEQQ